MSKNERDLRKRTGERNTRGWEILRDRFDKIRQRKKLMRVTMVLSCLVVFFVTYSMILPAITIEHDEAAKAPGFLKTAEKTTTGLDSTAAEQEQNQTKEIVSIGNILKIIDKESGSAHIAVVVKTDAESNGASVFVVEKNPEGVAQVTEVSLEDSAVTVLTKEEVGEFPELGTQAKALVQEAR